MVSSKGYTRKELERKLREIYNNNKDLVKGLVELQKSFEATRQTMVEMAGVIMALKRKGLIFDDEIAAAVTDARKGISKEVRVQPKETGTDESNIDDG